jgi:hypothetical protein
LQKAPNKGQVNVFNNGVMLDIYQHKKLLMIDRVFHAGIRWSTKRYLNMDLLKESELEKKMAAA